MSTRQFCEKVNSYYLIKQLLREFELSGADLQLEITENLMLEDSSVVMEMLSELRAIGVQLSVDDFGTGYSSLSYLRRFPVDILKIDRSFIQDLNLDSGDDALVKAIIAMGQSLGLKVIAEGVETKEQLQFLQAHECDMIQGYYFSKPVNAEEIERLLAKPLPN
jgi:EAL domain-containing protein (putative c-di-GMP-specific phosphodiesterase class I)